MSSAQIVVVTPFRGGSFDLASVLQDAGRLAAIYTGYPQFKLRNTRVDPKLIRTFPWLHTPFMALGHVPRVPQWILRDLEWHSKELIDAYAARTLPECGLVTAMSSIGLKTGAEIKRRGGVYVCERGSTHILIQQRILEEDYAMLGMRWDGIDPRVIEKEAAEYALADAIVLPSHFAIRSFVEMGIPASRLRHVPYGVDLSTYRRTAPRASNFRVLFAGQPTVRKGLHYLLEAFHRANLPGAELVLVGPPSPEGPELLARYPVKGLVLGGFVSRERVVEEMSRASVMVLPSIEDGFGLVIAQALACGCPVIATSNTGAPDIMTDVQEGFIVPARDVDALAESLTRLYNAPELVDAMSVAGVECVRKLGGWGDYGQNIIGIFDRLLDAGSTVNDQTITA